VAVLYYCPLAFILRNAFVYLITRRSLLTLNENSCIDGVLQNTDNRSRRPCGFCACLERGGILHSKRAFVFHRRENAELIQCVGYILWADALQFPLEDVPDNIGGVLINHQLVFILFIFQITESGKGTEKLPILPLDFKL